MDAKLHITPQTFTMRVHHRHHHHHERAAVTPPPALSSPSSPAASSPIADDRAIITITNTTPSASPIVYRMLTTDKKSFTVSPREGILPAGATHTIVVSWNHSHHHADEDGGDAEERGQKGEGAEYAAADAKGDGRVRGREGGLPRETLQSVASHDIVSNVVSVDVSFKLEYRALTVKDKDTLKLLAMGKAREDGAPSISDVIRGGEKKDRRSTVIDCVVQHFYYGDGGGSACGVASGEGLSASLLSPLSAAGGGGDVTAVANSSSSPSYSSEALRAERARLKREQKLRKQHEEEQQQQQHEQNGGGGGGTSPSPQRRRTGDGDDGAGEAISTPSGRIRRSLVQAAEEAKAAVVNFISNSLSPKRGGGGGGGDEAEKSRGEGGDGSNCDDGEEDGAGVEVGSNAPWGEEASITATGGEGSSHHPISPLARYSSFKNLSSVSSSAAVARGGLQRLAPIVAAAITAAGILSTLYLWRKSQIGGDRNGLLLVL